MVAKRYGTRILVCTDARLAADPAFAEILGLLTAEGLTVQVDSTVQPDVPAASTVASTVAAKAFAPDVVIGIGGGSCMDMAKCVALLLNHGGALAGLLWRVQGSRPRRCRMIAVPTTAGTGSEVTPVAVMSDPDRALKVGISSPHLIPLVAICDPELTLTCPPGLTAVAGADALTHAIEAFTAARREATPALAQKNVFVGKSVLSDHFAPARDPACLASSLEPPCKDGNNIEARAEVMMAPLAAGCAFGTAGTAAAHAIQYPVGTLTHTPHGLGVAC